METADAELDRLISNRTSQDRRPDPDEREELWQASVRAYAARRREEMRAEWCEHHQGQAVRLIADHEEQAEKYLPKGA
jgi:hypothetical protein